MSKKLEDQIAKARNMKDLSVKVWILNFILNTIIALTGYLTNRTDLIGTAYGTFIIVSIACIAWFSLYDNQEEDLMNELEKQNLEERIDELEQIYGYKNNGE